MFGNMYEIFRSVPLNDMQPKVDDLIGQRASGVDPNKSRDCFGPIAGVFLKSSYLSPPKEKSIRMTLFIK